MGVCFELYRATVTQKTVFEGFIINKLTSIK